MAYASVADAQLMYGAAQIAVCCDRDLDGLVDTDSFQLHLDMATATMDAYLLGRYPLPLTFVPAYFKQMCVDIALHTATPTADVATLAIEKRWQAAIHFLELVAANRVKLETTPQATAANISATPQSFTPNAPEHACCGASFDLCGRADRLKDIL